jgi:hypothetical protein
MNADGMRQSMLDTLEPIEGTLDTVYRGLDGLTETLRRYVTLFAGLQAGVKLKGTELSDTRGGAEVAADLAERFRDMVGQQRTELARAIERLRTSPGQPSNPAYEP